MKHVNCITDCKDFSTGLYFKDNSRDQKRQIKKKNGTLPLEQPLAGIHTYLWKLSFLLVVGSTF